MTPWRLTATALMIVIVTTIFANNASANIYEPINNAVVTGTNVKFVWSDSIAATYWWFQVSTDQSFSPSSLILNTVFPYWETDYTCGGTEACGVAKKYLSITANNTASLRQLFWRVAASINGENYSVWWPTGNFLQAPSLPAVPGIVSPINDAYTLLSG